MKQWKCSCGMWVPDGYSRHPHISHKEPTFEEMSRMRAAQEAALTGVEPDHFNTTSAVSYHWRTGSEPTRDMPL